MPIYRPTPRAADLPKATMHAFARPTRNAAGNTP